MKSEKVQKLVTAAMFSALCFLGTFLIKIPTFQGYIHLGDCMVLLSGLLLGPLYGGLAAGIGSCLSDLLAGYAAYIPGTFAIKAIAAALSAIIFNALITHVKNNRKPNLYVIISGIGGAIVVVFGYLAYEGIILSLGAGAIVNIPGNLIQGIAGIILGSILYPVLSKIPTLRTLAQSN